MRAWANALQHVINIIQNIEPMETPNKSVRIRERLFECIHNGVIDTPDLVQIFEVIGNDYLNCQTLSNYARNMGISYNGAKLQKNTTTINGMKFIINNE